MNPYRMKISSGINTHAFAARRRFLNLNSLDLFLSSWRSSRTVPDAWILRELFRRRMAIRRRRQKVVCEFTSSSSDPDTETSASSKDRKETLAGDLKREARAWSKP